MYDPLTKINVEIWLPILSPLEEVARGNKGIIILLNDYIEIYFGKIKWMYSE